MMKLFVSDIDNTLLLDGKTQIDEEIIDALEKMCDEGIVVAIASGRQYPNMRKLFSKIADRVYFISENGALIVYGEEILYENAIDNELALEIMEDIYSMPNCEVLATGRKVAYLKPKTEYYLHRIRDVVQNNVVVVEDFRDIKEPLLKLASFDHTGAVNSKDHYIEKFGKRLKTVVSGKMYVDFNNHGVNKGVAVKRLLEMLNISKDEAYAFGDSFNDIEMLEAVEHSYVMRNGDEEVKKYGKYICDSVLEVVKEKLWTK